MVITKLDVFQILELPGRNFIQARIFFFLKGEKMENFTKSLAYMRKYTKHHKIQKKAYYFC